MQIKEMKLLEEKNMDEIGFRELVGIVNKHKVLIIAIFIISAICSIIYSCFAVVTMYQAKAEVEINKVDTGVMTFDEDYSSGVIIGALLKQMEDPQYTEQVSKVLESKNIHISNSDLMAIISSSKGVNGRTIILTAKYKEKKDVAHIANAAADTLCELSSRYMREEIQQQLIIIEKQIELGRKNVDTELQRHKVNAAGQEGIDIQQSGIHVSEYLSVQHVDESYINGLYNDDLIPSIEVYKSLKVEYNRLKLIETYLNTNSNAYILLHAVEPEDSISPNRKGIIVLSMIAGLCVGILAAFTVEWLKHEKQKG